jgi:hypothetical protein
MHQLPGFVRDRNGCRNAGVELKEIGFNAVAPGICG